VRCTSIFGHKYEPRYDEVENSLANGLSAKNAPLDEVRRLMVRQVYVRDVCVRCGDRIERSIDEKKIDQVLSMDDRGPVHVAAGGGGGGYR